jgi:hypothetical protein
VDESAFLRRARENFERNMDWLEFEEFAFGMRSPIFSRGRTHRDVRENPLYIELRDMWLELGVRQGYIAKPENGEEPNASRRETAGRR